MRGGSGGRCIVVVRRCGGEGGLDGRVYVRVVQGFGGKVEVRERPWC